MVSAPYRASELTAPLFSIILGTDCRSLYDATNRLASSLSEKRTEIDVASIREALLFSTLKWMPTSVMPADGLTKMQARLRDALRRYLENPVIQFHHAPPEETVEPPSASE